MKTPKPGQLCTINNVVYRAYKAESGCEGCAFNNLYTCMGIVDGKTGQSKLDCRYKSIIFKRVTKWKKK